MQVRDIGFFLAQKASKRGSRLRITFAVQLANIVDLISHLEAEDAKTVASVRAVRRTWCSDDGLYSMQLLLPRQGLDVHFRSSDGIGMERERHVNDLHRGLLSLLPGGCVLV